MSSGIFTEDVQEMESLTSIKDKLRFITGKKKQAAELYSSVESMLKISQEEEKLMETAMNAPQQGQPVVGTADALDGAFQGEPELTA